MTKEEAYEKLELPIDSDLQSVRQQFAAMHNDYRMQIDNAFNPTSKRIFEQKLEELKEAYALLNESEGMDDNAILPRTGKSFDPLEKNNGELISDFVQALAVFGVSQDQDTSVIEQAMKLQIDELKRQCDSIKIVEARQVYNKVIDETESARSIVNKWLQERKQNDTQIQSSGSLLEQESGKSVSRSQGIRYIVLGVFVVIVLAIGYHFTIRNNNTSKINSTVDVRQDSIAWEAALVGNREASYHHYLKQFPEGIFANAIKDSLDKLLAGKVSEESDVKKQTLNYDSQPVRQSTEPSENIQINADPTVAKSQSALEENKDWQKKYDEVSGFQEGFPRVRLNGKWGFVDNTTGKEVIPLQYDYADSFSQGLAAVRLGGKWGLVNKSGQMIIPLKYESAGSMGENAISVRLNGKWGFIDKNDNLIIPLKYDYAGKFGQGLASVKLNGKWGYIDKSDYFIIPLKYEAGTDFSSSFGGLASVKLNGKWGFIDKTGREVITPKFDKITYQDSEKARVELNGKTFYINKQGECISGDCPD